MLLRETFRIVTFDPLPLNTSYTPEMRNVSYLYDTYTAYVMCVCVLNPICFISQFEFLG